MSNANGAAPDANSAAPNANSAAPPPPPDPAAAPPPDPAAATSPTAAPAPAAKSKRRGKSLGDAIIEMVRAAMEVRETRRHAQASAPEAPPTRIGDLVIDADTPISDIVSMLAQATGDTADVIAGIETQREHPVGQAVLHGVISLGYVLPIAVTVLIGIAIGLQYAGGNPFSLSSLGIFAACAVYDFMLVYLMFAISKQLRRFSGMRDLPSLLGLLLFYLFIATTSAFAQWVLYERAVILSDRIQVVGAAFRTLAAPVIDLVCAFVLPILQHVSLDQRLAEMRKKTEATIAINKQKMADQVAKINEAVVIKSTMQKERDYQKKNDLANRLIDLVSRKIIDDAERSLQNERRSSGLGGRRMDETR